MDSLFKKGIFICSIFLFSFSDGFSQSATVTSGGSAKTGEGSLSFSVGQVDYMNASTDKTSINAGVQQPDVYQQEEVNKKEVNNLLMSIKTFPNPTTDEFSVLIENDENWYSFVMTNVEGELIYQGKLKNNSKLSLSSQPIGTYLLKIYTDKRQKKFITIKIIKG